jgi:hypothetical protein
MVETICLKVIFSLRNILASTKIKTGVKISKIVVKIIPNDSYPQYNIIL